MIDPRRQIGSGVVWCLAACSLLGCQSEKTMTRPGDPLPPVPVAARATPPDSVVSDIVVLAPYSLSDLDGNGLASEFPIAVYLYASPFPLPFWQPGNIAVELFAATDEGERPLLDRRFSSEQLEGLKQSNVVGEFYALQLTLSDAELRQLSDGGAGYRVSFESLRDDSKVTSSVKQINVR